MTGNRHRLAIHTVFLPRENLLFIKEWLAYHTLIGVEHFYLYDNTGSVGCMGSTSTANKYGLDFHALTQGLSDAEIGAVMDNIFREFPGRITLVDWRPRNPQGDIEYAQQDAIRHCIAQFGADTTAWAPKNILRSDAFDPDGAWNMHGIGVRRGRTCRLDPGRLRFNHYNVNPAQLQWMQAYYKTSVPFALNAQDPGMRRYRRQLYRACRSYGSIWWRRAILNLSESDPGPI